MIRQAAEVELREEKQLEEPPPFLGTWKNVYLLLLLELGALVGAFYLLTRWAS